MLADVFLRPVPDGLLNDVWLRDPTLPDAAVVARDDRPPRAARGRSIRRRQPAIEAKSLYDSLMRRYGPVNAQRIYWLMREERKGPFAAGAKYDPED